MTQQTEIRAIGIIIIIIIKSLKKQFVFLRIRKGQFRDRK